MSYFIHKSVYSKMKWGGIVRLFALFLTLAVPTLSFGAEAVICSMSSDGQISSLMGTDFNHDTTKSKDANYPMSQMLKNTPVGIEIYPDESAATHHAGGFYDQLHSYDGNPAHYQYAGTNTNTYKNKYITTNKLHELFPNGNGKPFGWADGTNSFYVSAANPNGYICGVWFPWDLFKGRKFSLSYRFYVIESDVTKLPEMNINPVLTIGAHNACGGYNGVESILTNDKGDMVSFEAGNGVDLNTLPSGYKSYTNSHGTFNVPDVNVGYNVTYNISFVNYNTTNFDNLMYYPFLNCYNAGQYRIVIDYINISMEHLCVDRDSVCPGEDFNVTAIDYPLDAYLEWEYCVNYSESKVVKDSKGNIIQDNNEWVVFDRGYYSSKTTANLIVPKTVNFLDKITLRTHQTAGSYNSDVELTGGYSIPLTVTVADVKRCTPAEPDIDVHDICAPNGSEDVFEVKSPNPIAEYVWKLKGPDGNYYETSVLEFDGVNDENHTKTKVKATASIPEGKYTLEVFARNNAMTDASSDIVSFTFNIYQTPNLNILLKDEKGNSISETEKLCPSPLKMLKYTASISEPSADYTYTWTNAVAKADAKHTATINLGADADKFCDGSLSNFSVSAVINNHGCIGNASRDFTVETPNGPFIECASLVIPTLELAPTKDDIEYTFTLPDISSQCGETPSVAVTIVGPDGTAITPTVADGKVTATYPMGSSTVTIVATDDCGNTASCVKTVVVKDVTPPNVDCDELKDDFFFTTRLSYYGGACVATPGEGTNPEKLPVITNPSLEDRDHPGTMIEGEFVSRSDGQSLNDPFKVGVTTINWIFKDASGNGSPCQTTVTVIDDTNPIVTCTSTGDVINVSTDENECVVSAASVWDQVIEQMGAEPTAKLACSSSDISIVKTIYIKSEKEAKSKFKIFDRTSSESFEKDTTYVLIWSFKKLSADANVEADSTICPQTFKVVDSEQPKVTCGATSSFVITVNYKRNDPNYVYKYASGKKSDAFTQYTATSIIEDVPSATDNCGPVTMVVTVDSANAATHPLLTLTGTNAEIIEKLRPFEFMQYTTTTITYTFTDESGNSSECVKSISVIDRTVPVAKCFDPDVVTLSADENCQASYDAASLAKIKSEHMATMAFTRYTTTYRWDRGPANPAGAWVIKPGPNNPVQSTITYANEVAPSTITRQHYVKNADGEYELKTTDRAYAKPGLHTDADPGSYKIAKIQVDKFEIPLGPAGMGATPRPDETSRYRMLPTVGTKADGVEGHYILINEEKVLNTTFEKGKTVITVWYTNGDLYENGVFVEKGDSTPCELTVIVEDDTDPSVVCGDYSNLNIQHDLTTDDCTWPFDLPVPTLADLNAEDNCSKIDDLTLSYVRKFEGKDEEMDAPFKIGTTTLTWVVTDESGNSSTCENKIVIEDKKGPRFDCDKVTPKTINVSANEDCEATYADLKIKTPKSPNDDCSPVGTADSISAEGSRSDGLKMTDGYPKANSPITITWTVKDANNNISTCEQVVVISDDSAPSIKCDMEDLEFFIKEDACTVPAGEVEAKFTEHKAKDNCDGEIVGVPGTGVNGADPMLSEYPIGTTVVTWVFTDNAGNSSYCPQNVIVKDEIDPNPDDICPKTPFVADAVEGTCETNVTLPELTLYDECDKTDLTGVFKRFDDETLSATDPFSVGETKITWTFTDNASNVGVCEGKVIVNDITAPEVFCNYTVNDSLIFSMTVNECGAASSKVVEQVQIPYAYDECDKSRIDDYESQVWFYGLDGKDTPKQEMREDGVTPYRWNDPDYVYQPGYTHLLFIFKDQAGNSDKCEFTVFVKDNTPPSVDCDAIVSPYPVYPDKDECEVTLATVDLNELNNVKGYDHCADEFGNKVEYEGKPYNPGTDEPFELDHSLVLKAGEKVTIWWKYISPKGGTSLCVQDIQAIDTQAPVPDCDALLPIEVTADDNECSITGDAVAVKLQPYPVASDNCGDVTGVPSREDGEAIDSNYPTGTTTIIWSFSDSNPDNTVTCKQTVFVKGSVPPIIDCDTFGTFFDTIPDCETRPFKIRVPYAIDSCAPDTMDKMVAGVPSRSDGLAIDAPFPLGNTVVTWTFTDFTGNVSSSCNDTVNVRTEEKMIISCVEDIKPDMNEGDCDYQVTVPVATAKHPCLDVTFPGTPYLKGSTKPLPVVDGKLDYKFHVGNYTVLWVFIDSTTNSLVKAIDTCATDVQIGNKNQMPVDCDNYPAIKKSLVGNCSIDAAELGFNDPEVVDLCTGKTIIPYIYRTLRDKPTDTLKVEQLGAFEVGEQDTIVRIFSFISEGQTEGSTIECRQPVWILDSLNIKTNCLPEDSITTLMAEDGQCALSLGAVLDSIGTPEATDECIDHTIPGKPFIYKDGVLLPIKGDEMVEVGKITIIRWLFNDPLANIDTAYCDQKVTAMSNVAPIFDCSTLDTLPFLAKGECYVDLTDADIPTPVAIDSCTKEEVKGVGVRANGNPLTGKYYVGYDTIVWTFTSPNSSVSKSCEQIVYVRSDNEPKFNCDDLPDTTLMADGECELPVDKVLEMLGDPIAKEYCTDSLIHGVPTLVNGDSLPAKFPVGKTITIRWTFSMPEFTTASKICDQAVTVNGNAAPVFDCNTLDTIPFTAKGECSIDLVEADIPVPEAQDGCDEDAPLIPGVPSRKDGGDVYGSYPVGGTVITWTFKSTSSTEVKTCDQIVWVKTDNEIDANCGEENYPTQTFVITDNSCSIPSDSVKVEEHSAPNPCLPNVIISGVPTRSDNLAMTDEYPIGKTIITWTFVDTTNTLVHNTTTCEQIVEVKDEKQPVVDCETVFPAATIYLDLEDCSADFAMIPLQIDSIPVNPCNNDVAIVDTVRTSGAGMHDPYEVGKDTIVWTFTYQMTNQSFSCPQRVEVIDTLAPDFDCNALPDSVVVALSRGDSVSFQDVKDAGFIIPVVTDKCCEVTTTITRDDNKALEGNYGLGNTVVLFDFADDHDNHKQCSVTVIVKDMIPPVVTCPGLAQTNFDCINDTTVAYATYEEFKKAGGFVDEESKIIPESLGHFDVVEGDYCSADITRNYYLLTTRLDTVFCENPQKMHAEDDVKPEYVGILPGGESIVMGCDTYIDEPLKVSAKDNCDPDPKVNVTRTSSQSSDPNDCSYYTFDITYTYVAVDRCGNEAAPITYTIHVKDTVAPVVHEPADWKDEMYPTYLKNCEFGIPDVTLLIPKDSVYQNCGDASTLKIWQTPESGTLITETTVVYLHIEDVCGNDTVMQKVVRVQPRDEIIKVTVATDPYVCGDDASLAHPTSAENSLSNAQIRDYNGVVYYQDYDGSWVPVPTTVFWDYYRGSIAPENIVYSNNELTYADKFADAQDLYSEEGMKAFGKYNLLLRRSQSDTYYFVASDTITGCSDTAEVYIDVRERPRIDLAGGLWKLCEGDSLDINGEFKSTFPACVDALGGTIKEEGWLVNDSVYKHGEPVNYDNGAAHTAIYYAINECGTTRSDSSLYVSCEGDLETYADSLQIAGSKENMKLFQEDRLIIADSVILDVYTHFDPTQVLLSTNPQDKARIWEGDDAQLVLTLPYKPSIYKWYRVVNAYDGAGETVYDREGNIVSGGSLEGDDEDLGTLSKEDGNGRYVFTLNAPSDSSSYYVLVGNGVCPTEASNLVSIDVMHQLPTAITPYDRDGLNDDFMKGHYVIIFNRYGQKIVESNDGWDGTYRGLLADPGVYYYTVVMKTGLVHNGAIEVVKMK